jgi:hypothetical protein
VGVDEEEAAQGHRLVDENAVGAGDGLVQVLDEGVLDVADSAVIHSGALPGQVGELGVDGDAEHLAVLRLELAQAAVEGENLRWAHEGEVEGVEEEDDVFPPVIGEGDFAEGVVRHDRFGGKVRGFLGDERGE